MGYEAQYCGKHCMAKKVHYDKGDTLLKQEMRLYKLHRLIHPCVVQLFHSLDDPESLVLLMERMWMSLTDFLANKQSHYDKFKILRDVAFGLQYIHNRGIIHCDLTADNIMLTEKCTAKLADFGQATFAQQSVIRYLPETLDHVPPEIFGSYSKAIYSPKVDIFSFGCVIIHTFTQERPVPDLDKYIEISEVRKCKVNSEVERRSNCLKKFINKVNTIKLFDTVFSCLQDDPDCRPTAASLLSFFEQHLSVYIANSYRYSMLNIRNSYLQYLVLDSKLFTLFIQPNHVQHQAWQILNLA